MSVLAFNWNVRVIILKFVVVVSGSTKIIVNPYVWPALYASVYVCVCVIRYAVQPQHAVPDVKKCLCKQREYFRSN